MVYFFVICGLSWQPFCTFYWPHLPKQTQLGLLLGLTASVRRITIMSGSSGISNNLALVLTCTLFQYNTDTYWLLTISANVLELYMSQIGTVCVYCRSIPRVAPCKILTSFLWFSWDAKQNSLCVVSKLDYEIQFSTRIPVNLEYQWLNHKNKSHEYIQIDNFIN